MNETKTTVKKQILRKQVLVIVGGVFFIIVAGWIGNALISYVPVRPFNNGANQQSGQLNISLSLTPNPPKVGSENLVDITLKDSQGQPVDNATVSIQTNMSAMDMGNFVASARSLGNGLYEANAQFLMGGAWSIVVNAQPNGSPSATANFQVNVQ